MADISENYTNNFESLTDEQKIIFLRTLIFLANADDSFDDEELSFIETIADEYGLDKKLIQKYIKNDSQEILLADLKKISPRRVALELIKEMCFLAHSDDVLSDRETLFIGKAGQAMGIELEKIEQISNWVIDRIIWLEQARLIFEDVK